VSISILGGLLGVAAVFWFVRDAFGRDVAWASAWVVALHPWAVDFSSDVMSDGLYAGLFLLGFVAMARAVDRPNAWGAAFCGAVGGLAYLVRPEGAGLLVACLVLFVARFFADPDARRRVVGATAAMFLCGALVILPFVIAVGQQTGEFVLTQKKSISTLVGAPSAAPSTPRSPPSSDAAVAPSPPLPLPELAVRADGQGAARPARNGSGVVEALVRVVTTSMAAFRFELLTFALLGLWAMRGQPRHWRLATIAVPIVLYSGLLVLLVWGAGYVGRRHALAPWLPAVGLSVIGWQFLCTKVSESSAGQRSPLWTRLQSPRSATVVLVILLVISWGARDLRPRRLDRTATRIAAQWVAENYPESGAVAAQKLRTAYYAGARFVPLPPGHDGSLAATLRQREAQWVIIDAAKLDDHRGLEQGVGRWLRPVHAVSAEGRRALVFEIVAEPAS
jgi:4-amino-4-deoxy-L-arabinose transferase-like glycosyltransferase